MLKDLPLKIDVRASIFGEIMTGIQCDWVSVFAIVTTSGYDMSPFESAYYFKTSNAESSI